MSRSIGKAHVNVCIAIKDKNLNLEIENSKPKQKTDQLKEPGGIGLQNTKKRLDLIYGGRHVLIIEENSEIFTVDLSINLTQDS